MLLIIHKKSKKKHLYFLCFPPLISILSYFGGDEGCRTPVQYSFHTNFSECSLFFNIPSISRQQTGQKFQQLFEIPYTLIAKVYLFPTLIDALFLPVGFRIKRCRNQAANANSCLLLAFILVSRFLGGQRESTTRYSYF